MSALVQRLLGRSRAPVSGVRPRTASLFERRLPVTPAAPATFDLEDVSWRDGTPVASVAPDLDDARTTGPAVRAPKPAPPAAQAPQAPQPDLAPDRRSPRARLGSPRLDTSERAADDTELGTVPKTTRPTGGPVRGIGPDGQQLPWHGSFPALVRDERAPAAAADGRTVVRSGPPGTAPDIRGTVERRGTPPLLQVAAGPALAAPAPRAPDAAPPTVVEVTIGRLEVRTPPGPATAPPRPPERDHASVLEAYLRRRGKGELA